ncbi:MAG: CDP-archaeol synthase [Erysipelotrichales bacterium]|nr:CDP-archaeol synthase [Erysipelotrichales bacterium]
MLTRAITAILLIALFLPLFIIGGNTVYIMVIGVGLLILYEITSLRAKEIPVWLRVLLIIGYLAAGFMDLQYLAVMCFLMSFLLMIFAIWNENIKLEDVFMLSYVCSFIAFVAHAFLVVGLTHNMYMLIISAITYGNDTGAYFAGYFLGKHKFNERVSPKKTWEGSIGGFIASILFAVLMWYIFPELLGSMSNALIIGVVLGVAGQMGDLMFSLIKRHYNIKDYGSFLPGHGGALDRVDSLLINFALFFILMEILL